MRVVLFICAGICAAGCQGAIGDAPPASLTAQEAPAPPLDPNAPAYKQAAVQVRLLPFSVRLAKVAAVVGKPASDPLFAELVQHRYQLGDYDFANGIVSDNAWSASRMTAWVAALRPVCASADVAQRYPDLTGVDLDRFYRAANGRALSQEETSSLRDAVAEPALTAAQRANTVCLAVLSSLEFVAQ